MQTPIEIVIEGENLVNKNAYEIIANLNDTIDSLVDKKIAKVDSTLTSKVTAILKPFLINDTYRKGGNHYSMSSWLSTSKYHIILKVKICISGGSYDLQPNTAFTQYFQTLLYLGRIENGILKMNITGNGIAKVKPKKLTIKSQLKKVDDYKKLAEKLRTLKSEINPTILDRFYLNRL